MSAAALPASGDEIEFGCRAADTDTTVRVRPLKLDYTGSCAIRVTAEPDGRQRDIELTSLSLAAPLPDAGGAEDGGTITIELGASSEGRLRQGAGSSSVVELHVVAELTATVRQPDGVIELVSRKPVELTGDLSRCRLGGPVDFVVPGTPDTTTVQLPDLVLEFTPPGSAG